MKSRSTSEKTRFSCLFTVFTVFLCAIPGPLRPSQTDRGPILWSIGKADLSCSEFALATNNYENFKTDGFFVIGSSDPFKDWPYVHPGPRDTWAGSKPHTFRIVFGLGKFYPKDSCRFILAFTDTHQSAPPKLEIRINERKYTNQLIAGGGDQSIEGDLSRKIPSQIVITFPCAALNSGTNEIQITSEAGSWLLYDAVTLEGPDALKIKPVRDHLKIIMAEVGNGLYGQEGDLKRDVTISIQYAGLPVTGSVKVGQQPNEPVMLAQGLHTFSVPIDEVAREGKLLVEMKIADKVVDSTWISVKPVKKLTVYILPHSHTDIGYTEIQTAIEDKQVKNLIEGIEYARKTADYPEGAKFVWNVEVTWAADLYLNRLDNNAKEDFIESLKNGRIALNGMYLNELTGLCRPEELIRLFRYSTELAGMTGQKVDAAMISDVPGYTWGTVTAMAQAGIKYFSVAPNFFDRIGDILVKWENKPFYWISPSGQEKVLVWIPLKGYAMSHIIGKLTPEWVTDYTAQLDKMNYPYDIAYIRWSGHGDNAVPDPAICEFVKDWNTKYTWPKFIISSTSEAFSAFEKKYGDRLPSVKGDWTPYWEDGAGSSALETGMNRNSADRLSQAEVLWALQDPTTYPAGRFEEAWKKVLLYSEHTWGAWCSITDPENKMTIEQWEIKKGYADEAAGRAGVLLEEALNLKEEGERRKEKVKLLEVVNSTNWVRNEMVFLTKEQSAAGDVVKNAAGKVLNTQRMADGELAVLGVEVYPLSSTIISVSPGKNKPRGSVTLVKNTISNNLIECEIDSVTGDVIRLIDKRNGKNLVDGTGGKAANQYLFFEGNDLSGIKTSGSVTINIKENGPLIGCVEIASKAPGCNGLVRQIWLAHDADYLILINTVDKKRAPMPEKIGDWKLAQNNNKESVNFGFPFQVKDGIMRLDLPLGQMIPWVDQIPSACKNWYSVGRWADVSNKENGVTWITMDAPLVQVGELSARLVGSQNNPEVWRKTVEPTQALYSWAMNNHWGTNYRQYQEGPVTFRYIIRPHGEFNAVQTTELATGFSQPLLIREPAGKSVVSPVSLEGDPVTMITFKPADSGKGYLVRFYNSGSSKANFKLNYQGRIWLSNTGEEKIREMTPALELAGQDVLTLVLE
ncbi:MAG: polysaccharide lyase family protein [Bacteroidota bacterium]